MKVLIWVKVPFFPFVRHPPRQTTTGKEEEGGGGGEEDKVLRLHFWCRVTIVTAVYFRAQSPSLKMHLSTMIS